MKSLTIDPRIEADDRLRSLVDKANRLLESELGPSGETVSASWQLDELLEDNQVVRNSRSKSRIGPVARGPSSRSRNWPVRDKRPPDLYDYGVTCSRFARTGKSRRLLSLQTFL